jgi:trigger factor
MLNSRISRTMHVKETLNEGLKRAFALTIPSVDIDSRVDQAVAEVAPQVRMPGFRPGKVPANLIRRMHGEALRGEAIQKAVDESLRKLLADYALRPAMQPSIDVDQMPTDGADLVVSVALEVLPEIAEMKTDGIVLEKLVVEADGAAVDQALERLAQQQKRFVDAKKGHKARIGDLVVMDYRGSVEGKPFDGGTGTAMEVELGSGRLIPGFEAQLEGAKQGEKRTVTLNFPEDYPAANLAGQPAEFAVEVTAVKVPEVPAVDEELVKNLGLESLDQLREILKDQVEAELSGLTRTYMKRKLLDHLAATHQFDVPPSMVDAEFQQIWRQLTEGASDDDKARAEAERGDYGRIAERRVRLGLLLSEIGTANGITITNAEMNRLVAEEAARYPGQEAQVRKYFSDNPMAAAQLRAPLFEEKVVDFLLGRAEVTERRVSRAELEAAIESEDETPIHGHVHGPDCDHDHDHGHGETADARPKKAKAAKAPKADKSPKAGKAEPQAEAADAGEAKPKTSRSRKTAA